MLFSLHKHHLDLNITDTALKVSRSLYCFTTSISHVVENYFPRLWGTGISDAIFKMLVIARLRVKFLRCHSLFHLFISQLRNLASVLLLLPRKGME